MKLRTTSFVLLSVLSLLWFTSCTECDPQTLEEDGSSFGIFILDETTGENIFFDRYDAFSFQILDEFGDTTDLDNRRYSAATGNFGFTIDPTEGRSLNYDQRNQSTFHLHFDSTEVDTLLLFYVPQKHRCNGYLDNFEAYYNEELIAAGSGRFTYSAELIKQF